MAATAGSIAADTLASKFGFKDKRIEAGAGFIGAVGGAALAGAFFGPIGVAIGAGVGAASFVVSNTAKALMNANLGIVGPKDNWVYYETKDAPNMCFGSYSNNDKMYTIAHTKKNPAPTSSGDCFSAG